MSDPIRKVNGAAYRANVGGAMEPPPPRTRAKAVRVRIDDWNTRRSAIVLAFVHSISCREAVSFLDF